MQRIHHGAQRRQRDVRRIEVREYQQIGFALQPRMRIDALAQMFRQRRIGMHLAVALQVRRDARQDRRGLPHLECARRVARSEIREREQGGLGFHAETPDLLGCQDGHLGDLLRRRIDRDMGVGEKDDAALRNQHRQR